MPVPYRKELMKKIGILTGGADCPGLNSVIRAVVRKGMQDGYVVAGIKNGWLGLIENDMRILDIRQTSGILDKGGTILGTSRVYLLGDPVKIKQLAENYKRSGLDALIAVGGEETLKIALDLFNKGIIKVVGVPSRSIMRFPVRITLLVLILLSMLPRNVLTVYIPRPKAIIVLLLLKLWVVTGWIALEAGIAGGADEILVPEIPTDLQSL